MQNKFCFIIPVYNHGATVEAVLTSLKPYGFPIIVVDDGNDQRNKDLILAAVKKFDGVSLVTARKNGGKGKAFALGIREANRMGYTHAFQIDADGQHDSNCCSIFQIVEIIVIILKKNYWEAEGEGFALGRRTLS